MQFIGLLQKHHITHIIDIRSIPYSRQASWSNKSRLPEMLKPFNIRYSYLGHKLGGKKQSIDQVAQQQGVTPEAIYDEAIQILLHLSIRDNLSLLCAEADPAKCHRQHIIAQTLLKSEVEVIHILKDGTLKEAWREDPTPKQPALFNE